MADLNYTARVDVSQAEASLSRLQKSVSGVSDTFVRLKTTLATISLGAVISQSIQFADAISDLSDASEIAIGNILGFSKAVEANGGSADGAQKAILRLVNSIGEAAEGSLALQNAFAEVGVTLNDLRTTSNQDILKKTIEGLDKIDNSAKRSILVTQLLGKEFRNVATGGLATAYNEATAKSQQYADAIAKGAAAQQNIDKTLGEFKLGLLEAIKPFTELVSKVNVGVENFQKFVQALLAVGAALATFTIVGRVWRLFVLFFDAIVAIVSSGKNLVTFISELVSGWRALYASTEGVGGVFARILLSIQAVGAVLAETLGPAFVAVKSIAMPVLAGIAGYWGWIQDSTSGAIDKLREYASALTFGLISPPSTAGGGRGKQGGATAEELAAYNKKLDEQKRVEREVTDALAKKRQEIQKASEAFKRQNNDIIDNINLEKSFVGKTEDYVEVQKAVEEVLKRAANESLKLREAKAALGKDEAKLAGEYDRQIAKIVETAQVDAERISKSVEGLQGLRLIEKARKQDIENTTKSIEDQIARQQTLGDILRGINDQRKDVGFQADQQKRSPLQRQMAEIQENARKAALEAGRAFAAAFEDTGDGMTPEKAQEFADGLAKIAEGYKGIADAQTANLEASRSWESGWKEAFDAYAENANNAAGQAKTYFDTFTTGMENALVNFVQTGKLSFKDLANSIIADFIRIQTRRAMVGIFGGGGFGSLFGFAAGGATDMSPMIVGERGPELFIPNSAGKIIPNNQLGGGRKEQSFTQVTYNIQAVDTTSFKQLVARDPQFIYSVTEKGRRSVPSRS